MSFRLERPRNRPRRAYARLTIRAVHPNHRPRFTVIQFSIRDESIDADPRSIRLLARDEHARQRRIQLWLQLPELRENRRHQRHVSQAIRRPSTVQFIPIHRQFKRIHAPRFGIRRHDVHVTPRERQLFLLRRVRAASRVPNHHVAPSLGVRHVFDLEHAPVFDAVRLQGLEDVFYRQIFARDVRRADAGVLKVSRLADESGQEVEKDVFVEF